MTNSLIPLDKLMVIGYANVLNKSMLPSIVPAIFKLQASTVDDQYFVPPYYLHGSNLCSPTSITREELQELQQAQKITLIANHHDARNGFSLWIDLDQTDHYELNSKAQERLQEIAQAAVKRAQKALQMKHFENASAEAAIAISADPRMIEPLAIEATVLYFQKRFPELALIKDLAKHSAGEHLFDLVFDSYKLRPLKTRSRSLPSYKRRRRTPPMRGAARQRNPR